MKLVDLVEFLIFTVLTRCFTPEFSTDSRQFNSWIIRCRIHARHAHAGMWVWLLIHFTPIIAIYSLMSDDLFCLRAMLQALFCSAFPVVEWICEVYIREAGIWIFYFNLWSLMNLVWIQLELISRHVQPSSGMKIFLFDCDNCMIMPHMNSSVSNCPVISETCGNILTDFIQSWC